MTASKNEAIFGLLLVGGESSRMGQPKAMLPWRGAPLYQHVLQQLLAVCSTVYISLPASHPLLPVLSSSPLPPSVHLLLDNTELFPALGGPALPLLSAHALLPGASFFAVAVDFPLAPAAAFSHLLGAYTPPVSCYWYEEDGGLEPLFCIWSSEALQLLQRRVQEEGGSSGPCGAIRQLLGLSKGGGKKGKRDAQASAGKDSMSAEAELENVTEKRKDVSASDALQLPAGLVRPLDRRWLFNTNTPEDWAEALRMADSLG